MEVNRDEAERCLQIAKQRLAQGNFAAALKFAKKSVSMYPTTDSKSFLAKLEQSTETGAAGAAPRPNASAAAGKSSPSPSAAPNPQDQGGLRNRGSKGHSSSSSPKPYTKEQLDAVNKIRACRNDHYKVLSVERTASEADIKKAYKKLALQFHPDKNSAPGADEAFKLVSHAFTVLNDADKRAHYDRFGEDSRVPSSGAQFRRQPGFAARGPMEFEDEISPEELFNMFFGTMGGGFGGGTYRVRQFGGGNPFFTFQNATRQQYQQRQAQEGRDHAQHGLLSACIQFLPLIVLVALFLVSNFFSAFTDIDSTPSYSFSQQGPFNQHRVTLHYKVPYWVNSDEFAQSNVARRPSLVRQFEKDIETHYISHLHQSCQQEMMRKRRLVHNARGWFGLAKDKDKMREAERMPMPACEELKRFRSEH